MLTGAAALAAFALAPTAGAINPQIAGLQIALRQHGLYRGPIDAVQGPKTVHAVRVFQRRHRLAVDGVAGPRTRAALGRRGRPFFGARAIRRGARGYDVGVLQFLLRRHGLRVGRFDGSFGPRTAAAVRRFQRRVGLRSDAIVGPRTTRRLCALAACAWRADSRAATPHSSVHAAIDYWSRTYGVDAHLVGAVARWESGYNNSLVSTAGARGVMQVTPATWDYVETVLVGRRIPRTTSGNVQVGVAFLDRLLSEFRGDVRLALGAYLQGPRSVRRHGLFRGTRHYVAGVLALSHRL
jgi:peptidoglycan hydrolase-like protein with peptidoglycan-binding domain